MNWLALIFAIEVGLMSQRISVGGEVYEYERAGYTELDGAVSVGGVLDVGGRVSTRFVPAGGYEFAPFDVRFTAYANLHRGGVTVGAEHTCYHPVLTGSRPDVGYLFGGDAKIFVRFEHGR